MLLILLSQFGTGICLYHNSYTVSLYPYETVPRRHLGVMVNKTRNRILISVIGLVILTSVSSYSAASEFFTIEPETAKLSLERNDYKIGSVAIVKRSFRRLQKDRGFFGPGWCSNLDLKLSEVEEAQPKVIVLNDCMLLGKTAEPNRKFRKFLDAWVEESSASRILRKPDGRWEQTEFPQAIFRRDGQLESFLASDKVRWHLRRDGSSQLSGLDNLKGKSVKFRRNVAGDLDAILDGQSDGALIRYRLTTMLESAQVGQLNEAYEYDADGNLLRLLHSRAAKAPQVWRFAYTTSEWVSKVYWPDGCVSEWLFERSGRGDTDFESQPVAKESKNCRKETLEAVKPVTLDSVSRKLASAPKKIEASPRQVLLKKPGPLGIGEEKAQVTMNRDGLPTLFEIVGPDQQVRRLEIEREDFSGSTLKIRSRGVEVSFKKRPREYEAKQLELLDDYETWMSAWGSR